jgi:hypothetical protein
MAKSVTVMLQLSASIRVIRGKNLKTANSLSVSLTGVWVGRGLSPTSTAGGEVSDVKPDLYFNK